MSRFNSPSVGTKVTNRAGGQGYSESDELKLASILLTSFANDQFYRSADQSFDEIKGLLEKVDPMFAMQAAVYARTKFGMRSITHVLAGEMFRGKSHAKSQDFLKALVYRPDDATEIMSYFMNKVMNKTVPAQLKKGLAASLSKFNSYQLAKYRGEGKAIKMVDLFNMVHPKPTKELEPAFRDLIEGNLKSVDTWEAKLTRAGQAAENEENKADLKAEAWKDLLESKKIGYFALLRNLRNILKDAPDLVDTACELLVDEKAITKSLVMPFRFQTAHEEIEKINGAAARKVLSAIEKAIDVSCRNVPDLGGNTCIIMDCSGSMCGRPMAIGSLFSAVLAKASSADIIAFACTAKYVKYSVGSSVMDIAKKIHNMEVGGSTNVHMAFREMTQKYDNVILLSDMQAWDSGWGGETGKQACDKYVKKFKVAQPYVYSFDLQGYGSLQFPEDKTYYLCGFSEKTLDLLKLLKTDRKALVNEIKKITF